MVRRAEARDIPALMGLLDQVNLVHHLGRPDLFRRATKYSPAQLEALLGDPTMEIFVFEDESGAVLGHAFCQLQKVPPTHRLLEPVRTLYIDDICVDAAARRQGVGSALCQHVKDRARELGCHNITLNVWACNPGAEAFYRKSGFLPQKTGMEVIL